MITLNLDWREVLWWMQGGMTGSHLRWSVYEDMVNKVWPQCSEQERRNIWLIMRRDLGSYWRPDGWSGFDLRNAHGEGEWKPAAAVLTYSGDPTYDPAKCITDLTPWTYFRQVLSRFDPENQYAVTMAVHNQKELDGILRDRHMGHLIDWPKLSHARGVDWESDTAHRHRPHLPLAGGIPHRLDAPLRREPDNEGRADRNPRRRHDVTATA